MKLTPTNLQKLPDEPGVYLFYDKDSKLMYVGKATSLKNRVRSYFQGKRTSRPIEQMIDSIVEIRYKKTDSVLEAIIWEAEYIKKYNPRYNVIGKDNKSWNYIVITKVTYPVVKTIRQHELEQQVDMQKLAKRHWKIDEYLYIFGPYSGLNTKAAMKVLTRLFHISHCQTKRRRKQDDGKPCLYRQMGTCLGVCTGEISPTQYKKQVIMPLVTFLRGGKKRLITTFKKRMDAAAKEEDYETAARIRDQLTALERMHDVTLINDSFFNAPQLEKKDNAYTRIEGYDISNLGKTGKVGSMVVSTNGEADKKEYRKFKIKTVDGQSDVDCLTEVLMRRMKHDEWTMPDVIMVDGGKPQVNAAKKVMNLYGAGIPIVGIAKGPDRKKNEFIFGSMQRDFVHWVNNNQDILVRLRDEAHRFAITYQKKLRRIT